MPPFGFGLSHESYVLQTIVYHDHGYHGYTSGMTAIFIL